MKKLLGSIATAIQFGTLVYYWGWFWPSLGLLGLVITVCAYHFGFGDGRRWAINAERFKNYP